MFDDNGSFIIALFEFFLFFAWIMVLFWVFSDIFRSHDLGGFAKTIWVLFVIIIPVLGVLVYLLVRGRGMSQRAIEQQQQMQAAQADYIKSVAGSEDPRPPTRSRRPSRCSTPARSTSRSSTR